MNICVDVDDVLADFVTSYLKEHNFVHGTNHKREDIKTYTGLPDLLGMSREELWNDLFVKSVNGFFRKIKIRDGAVKVMNDLYESGNGLYIVTHRVAGDDTFYWLNNHLIKYDKLLLTGDKKKIYEAVNADVVLEDNLEHAYAGLDCGARVFLFDQPWNAGHHPMIRCYSWEDFGEKFGEVYE